MATEREKEILRAQLEKSFEACTGERHPRRSPDFEVTELPPEPHLPSGVATTKRAMATRWRGDKGRTNQAQAFLKRAKKSDRRRKLEKQSRKRNRR